MAEKSLAELKAEFRSDFERNGEDRVRLNVVHGRYSGTRLTWALEWLAEVDQSARLRTEASQEERLATAKSAKDAAWEAAKAAREAARQAQTANMIATLALMAAAVAIAVSILSTFMGD